MPGLLLALLLLVGCGGGDSVIPPNEPIPPACTNPAPLLGQYDPLAPGYIVVYRAGVNSAEETARLAELYAFVPRFVFTSAIQGFAAELTPDVVAAVRCEMTVDHVVYDHIVSVLGSAPVW